MDIGHALLISMLGVRLEGELLHHLADVVERETGDGQRVKQTTAGPARLAPAHRIMPAAHSNLIKLNAWTAVLDGVTFPHEHAT